MFNNIGKKLKYLAEIICGLGIGISILVVVGMFIAGIANGDISLVFRGVFTSILIFLGSWAGNLTIYGFGQLIENSDKLVKNSDILVERSNMNIYTPEKLEIRDNQ